MDKQNKFFPFGSRPGGREKNDLNRNAIIERINPTDFYVYELDKVLMKKPGWINAGVCPFHVGDTPGSLHVDLNTGAFACLSCEVKGRDIVDFTMLLYGLTLSEALEKLAQQWNCNMSLNGSRSCNMWGCNYAKN